MVCRLLIGAAESLSSGFVLVVWLSWDQWYPRPVLVVRSGEKTLESGVNEAAIAVVVQPAWSVVVIGCVGRWVVRILVCVVVDGAGVYMLVVT